MPGEQRRRGHHEHLTPPASGDQPRQRRKPQTVGWLVTNPADLAAKDSVSCRSTRSSRSLTTWPRVNIVRQPCMQRTSR